MHPDWARSLRDQCQAANVPFFFKQWGEWAPASQVAIDGDPNITHALARDGMMALFTQESMSKVEYNTNHVRPSHWEGFRKIGKARAGRQLDNQEHNAYPA
jgi:L-rhamnose isomerase